MHSSYTEFRRVRSVAHWCGCELVMSAQVNSDDWDMIGYLVSLGFSRKEAVDWARDRQGNEPFKVDWSDAVGGHLDKVWNRCDSKPDMATGQVPITIESRSSVSRLASRKLFAILWAYSFAIWIYVIAFQIAVPGSLYWNVAWWLPIRMDYFGEIGFIFSFVFGILWIKLS